MFFHSKPVATGFLFIFKPCLLKWLPGLDGIFYAEKLSIHATGAVRRETRHWVSFLKSGTNGPHFDESQ